MNHSNLNEVPSRQSPKGGLHQSPSNSSLNGCTRYYCEKERSPMSVDRFHDIEEELQQQQPDRCSQSPPSIYLVPPTPFDTLQQKQQLETQNGEVSLDIWSSTGLNPSSISSLLSMSSSELLAQLSSMYTQPAASSLIYSTTPTTPAVPVPSQFLQVALTNSITSHILPVTSASPTIQMSSLNSDGVSTPIEDPMLTSEGILKASTYSSNESLAKSGFEPVEDVDKPDFSQERLTRNLFVAPDADRSHPMFWHFMTTVQQLEQTML